MRLIDADALSKLVGEPIEVFLRRLDLKLPPTVDAVKVVRCKDCRWSCWNNCECIRSRLYRHNSISLEGESYFRKIEPNDFCSWGERRENER